MNVNVLRFQSNMHVHSLKCHQFEEISKKIDDHWQKISIENNLKYIWDLIEKLIGLRLNWKWVYKYRTKLRFSQIKKTITNTNGLGIERKKGRNIKEW